MRFNFFKTQETSKFISPTRLWQKLGFLPIERTIRGCLWGYNMGHHYPLKTFNVMIKHCFRSTQRGWPFKTFGMIKIVLLKFEGR